jgi:hypothetical protein
LWALEDSPRGRGLFFLEIQMDHLLALGHVEVSHAAQDLEGFAALDGLLAGVLFIFGREVVLGKVPLRLGAGLSARAQVGPIDLWHRYELVFESVAQ